MTAVYPTIQDYDAHVRSYLPAPAAIGASESYVQALASPWARMEADIEALVLGLVDLDVAPSWVLDVAGARVGEARGGLSDTEYRRIIAGRRLSIGSSGSNADVYRVLLALAGTSTGRILLITNTTTGLSGVWLQALIALSPTAGYLLRAGAVLRDALPLDAEAVATVYVSGSLTFDAPPPLDAGLLAYTLPME